MVIERIQTGDGPGNGDCPAYEDLDESILRLAIDCEKLFTGVLSSINTTDKVPILKQLLEELQSRFSNWASYLGVFASKKTNLDRRLRGRIEYRDLVLLALDMLRANLFQRGSLAILLFARWR
jgi:hypothetical protein